MKRFLLLLLCGAVLLGACGATTGTPKPTPVQGWTTQEKLWLTKADADLLLIKNNLTTVLPLLEAYPNLTVAQAQELGTALGTVVAVTHSWDGSPPPSDRLAMLSSDLDSVMTHTGAASTLLVSGLSNMDETTIDEANTEFGAGTTAMQAANDEMDRLTAKYGNPNGNGEGV